MNRPVSGLLLVVATAGIVSACAYDDPVYLGIVPPRAVAPTERGDEVDPNAPEKGPQPVFGPTVRAAVPPPPLSGGTLTVLRDGRLAAADPDRDRVYVVDPKSRAVVTVPLEANDEPGRVLEDAEGRVHVVLRSAGKVATIDAKKGTVLARRDVCPAPRGIALDSARTHVIVACESGELMALAVEAGGPPPEAKLLTKLDRDLRDVVVTPTRIYVSRMRSAEVIELSPSLAPIARTRPNANQRTMHAMRMVAAPQGDPVAEPIVVHETGRDPVPTPSGSVSYGSSSTSSASSTGVGQGCTTEGPIVLGVVSRAGSDPRSGRVPDMAALPIDVAASSRSIAVVAAGNAHTPSLPQIYTFPNTPNTNTRAFATPCLSVASTFSITGEAIAAAYLESGDLAVQSREPATIELLPSHTIIPLASESRNDTGHALFHANSGAGLACASCHPEGGDDGQVWRLDANGPMRTTSLRGTLAGTAPFHWRGDVPDFSTLSDRIMTGRMNGPKLDASQKTRLEEWLYALPGAKVAAPSASSERGRAIFERKDVGCASCHSGDRFTTPGTVEVGGTSGRFQVPSLVGVSSHAPFFHNGCAPNLQQLGCGGTVHATTKLGSDERRDLLSYLETL